MNLGTVLADRVCVHPHRLNSIEPSSTEATLISILRAHGNVLGWDRFQELASSAGVNPITFGIYLSSSPVIARVDRGIYSLVGANLRPGTIEEMRHEISSSRKPAEYGWSSRGTLWYALPVNGTALGHGAVILPTFVADLVQGEWPGHLAGYPTDETIKCNGPFLRSLRKSLINSGAESGDTCILEFDLSKRTLNVFVGSEEAIELWEKGLERASAPESEEQMPDDYDDLGTAHSGDSCSIEGEPVTCPGEGKGLPAR
jgi:hypothetical protein